MIKPFAKQTNDYLKQVLQNVNQLYFDGQSDLEQLKKLQKIMPPNDSSILELLQIEQACSKGLLQVQQITQQIQQQLQQEYDPEHAI